MRRETTLEPLYQEEPTEMHQYRDASHPEAMKGEEL